MFQDLNKSIIKNKYNNLQYYLGILSLWCIVSIKEKYYDIFKGSSKNNETMLYEF
jgi:hypothetical protein